jgi:hypothetical protein
VDNGLIGRYEEWLLTALVDRAVGADEAELAYVLPWCTLADLLPDDAGRWRAVIAVPVWAQLSLPEGAAAAATKCAKELSMGGRWVHRVELIPGHPTQDWRRESAARAIAVVRNQGTLVFPGLHRFLGMRFKSKTEVRLAQALHRRGIPFMANPRFCWLEHRREPDFVAVIAGRLYVVEIHGAPWHPSGRTAIDFQRDLVYRYQGIEVVPLDAAQVWTDAEKAVDLLLKLAAMRRAA